PELSEGLRRRAKPRFESGPDLSGECRIQTRHVVVAAQKRPSTTPEPPFEPWAPQPRDMMPLSNDHPRGRLWRRRRRKDALEFGTHRVRDKRCRLRRHRPRRTTMFGKDALHQRLIART